MHGEAVAQRLIEKNKTLKNQLADKQKPAPIIHTSLTYGAHSVQGTILMPRPGQTVEAVVFLSLGHSSP